MEEYNDFELKHECLELFKENHLYNFDALDMDIILNKISLIISNVNFTDIASKIYDNSFDSYLSSEILGENLPFYCLKFCNNINFNIITLNKFYDLIELCSGPKFEICDFVDYNFLVYYTKNKILNLIASLILDDSFDSYELNSE